MAVLRPSSVFKNEGTYEVVNNMKILQREYISNQRHKKDFDSAIKLFQAKRSSLKTPNESFVYQQVLHNDSSIANRSSLPLKRSRQKRANKIGGADMYYDTGDVIDEKIEEDCSFGTSNTFSRDVQEGSLLREDK